MRSGAPRKEGPSDAQIVRLRDSGATGAPVAAEVGLSLATVRTRYLATQGVVRRPGVPFIGSTRRPKRGRPVRAPRVSDEQLVTVKSWGATHREAAAMLGMSPAAVAARLYRLRRRDTA